MVAAFRFGEPAVPEEPGIAATLRLVCDGDVCRVAGASIVGLIGIDPHPGAHGESTGFIGVAIEGEYVKLIVAGLDYKVAPT